MQCNANSLPHGHLRLMGKLQMQKIGRTNFKLTLLHLVLFREYYLKTHTHTQRGNTAVVMEFCAIVSQLW